MPKDGRSVTSSLQDRFWAKVRKSPGCWAWLGAKTPKGYGMFVFSGRVVRAHRLAYTLCVGPIPSGLHVLHSCDNPGCVAPSHLRIGTNADNMREKAVKGRAVRVLNSAAVKRIRKALDAGALQKDQAAIYGVSPSTISLLARRINWAHVE